MAKVMATNEPTDKKFLPWMPYIFGFIFLMALVGFIFLFSQKQALAEEVAPTKATADQIVQPVKAMLNDIRAKRFKDAYSKGSTDFKITMSYDGFSRFLTPYDALQDWTSATYSNPQIGQDVAAVVAYLQYEKGEPLPITFTVVREEGQWKVYGFVLNRVDLNVPIGQIEEMKDLIKAVNQDLAYLSKENTLSAYYKMTTRRFQQEMPYETFIQFVEETPLFAEQQGATLYEGKVEGDRGQLKVSLASEDESLPLEFYLAKEEGKWKVDKIEILTLPTVQRPLQHQEVTDSLETIELFLENLREYTPEKAYHIFTSKGFQESTPLNLFETFVDDHPILESDLHPRLIEGGKEGEERILYLVYPQHPTATAFEVKLIPEDGSWKIQSLSMESAPGTEISELVDKGTAIDLVQNVLNLLSEGQYEKFYTKSASRGFTKNTSYEEMVSYLQAHPALTHNPKAFILEMVQDRDQLFVETDLIDDSHTYSALFVFVYERGQWKVQRMETKTDRKISNAFLGQVNLSQMLVGQKISDDGMVQDSGQTIEHSNEPIYINVLLTSAYPEEGVELQITHQESESQTAPVVGQVDDEGNNILTFSFVPPPEGWPEGHYRARARTDANQTLETTFQIENFN